MPKNNENGRKYCNNPGCRRREANNNQHQGRRRRAYYNAPDTAEKAAYIQLLVENVYQVGDLR